MRTATALTLLAVGAIFAFAVNAHPSFLNFQILGWVLILTAIAGLVLPRRGRGWLRRTVLVKEARDTAADGADEGEQRAAERGRADRGTPPCSRSRSLSSSLVPPQTPYTWRVLSAKSRHWRRTGQPAQTIFAWFRCAAEVPTADNGKKSSGSAVRQAARERQSAAAFFILVSLPPAPALVGGVAAIARIDQRATARESRDTHFLRGARPGWAPTRITSMVMSSMRWPAVNSSNVRRMAPAN